MELIQLDPVALIALATAREAIADAGLSVVKCDERDNTFVINGIDTERAGVFFGTGIGGSTSLCDDYVAHILSHAKASLYQHAHISDCMAQLCEDATSSRRVNPFVVSRTMPNTIAAAVSIKLQLHGPSQTICQACASGTAAIGHAYRAIKSGVLDTALAGGAEYFSDRAGGLVMSFDVARTLAKNCDPPERANRPFDVNRSGFLISEGGAATLLLESLEHAIAGGRRPIVEVVGYGETSDAFSMMSNANDRKQARRMIYEALKEADVGTNDVDYINSHGTGTVINDAIEGQLIEEVFGDRVFINSTKGIIGHTIGASGALEAAVTVLSIRNQLLHPCANLEIPIAPLNFVMDVIRGRFDIALTYSFGFGGHNSGLVFKRC